MGTDSEDLAPVVSTEPAFVPSNTTPLVGRYVRLEDLSKSHIPSLFMNLGLPKDTSVFDWLPWTDPLDTEDELWSLFERLRKHRNFIIYAVRASRERLNPGPATAGSLDHQTFDLDVLGTIGYLDVNTHYRTLEVGAVLFGPALRRSAAATEAHYLLLRNVCEQEPSILSPPYRRITWKCNSLNGASRRAAERIGYVFEGILRKHVISKGFSRDSDLLSIVDDDWPTVKKTMEAWLDVQNFDYSGRQVRTLEYIRAHLLQ